MELDMKQEFSCDKCGSTIVDGFCDCGQWFEKEDQPLLLQQIQEILEEFAKDKEFKIFSGDHHSGLSILIFRGDYNACMRVREYTENIIEKGVK